MSTKYLFLPLLVDPSLWYVDRNYGNTVLAYPHSASVKYEMSITEFVLHMFLLLYFIWNIPML